MNTHTAEINQDKQRNFLIRILSAAAFLLLFQIYLIGPLIPVLSRSFHAPVAALGLLIPAYTIPYGLSTLVYGPLSDRIGRKFILITLSGLLALTTLLVPACQNLSQLIALRIFAGLATGGIVPVSVSLVGDVFPYEKRGRPIGMMFGAMAGGISFGASLGIFFNPILGWKNEFLLAGGASLLVFIILVFNHKIFPEQTVRSKLSPANLAAHGWKLLSSNKGKWLYSFIFFNGMFHSGVFSWLGYYFKTKYQLGDQGVGLALLGYGIPGILFGVTIGKLADRYGRQKIIPLGLFIGAFAVAVLVFNMPLWYAAVAVTLLSLGYDMTQPMFAGMVTAVGDEKTRGLAVALSSCTLFLGYGTGAYLFQVLLHHGMQTAFLFFSGFEFLLSMIAFKGLKAHP